MTRSAFSACLFFFVATAALAADANRLTYLDEFCDPYYPHRDFAKLTTPQWVGEEGVDCVVVLAIDDMRDPEKYEAYLRPILDRLKKIDGRAPVSIMTNQVDPQHKRLQEWLKEGLSLEVHTFDHPCPCLAGGDFKKAKGTYDKCVDLMHEIPGNKPVAFRMPCCDSLNTPSPRFWVEAFNKTTEQGNFLTIDSSVFNVITSKDASLPKEITQLENGEERFRRYIPFPSFVNTIEDYPYPYVIAGKCWQFPCVVPSDWSAQHVQKPNNPDTVRDLKLALDACVIKQGVYNLVFHPHGWIRSEQIVELIDHAVAKHEKKVKFLNFRECDERLTKNLLAGQGLRNGKGDDNGVRLLDANGDGYMDVVIGNAKLHRTRIWDPREKQWLEGSFPDTFDPRGPRFGVLLADGRASMVTPSGGAYHLTGTGWKEDERYSFAKSLPSAELRGGESHDFGLRLRDLDGDGACELLLGESYCYLRWRSAAGWDQRHPFPENASIVFNGQDAGLRFVDLDKDGDDDLLFANDRDYGIYLFESIERGWSEAVVAQGVHRLSFPLIVRLQSSDIPFQFNSTNNGAWFHSGHLWVQNEDTSRLPDHVDRRSFKTLLGVEAPVGPKPEPAPEPADKKPIITPTDRKSAKDQEATEERIKEFGEAKSPEEALKTIHVPEGFKVELVAAEPLVVDPVAFDWGPDGRLWVVEMRDYPRGLDDKGQPGGRVKVLTDKDGDGKYDDAKVFLDHLPFPTGIKVWKKGALITAAPEIIYAEDNDGNGKADVARTLYLGFGEGNQQHRVNGLRWGLDNWLYIGNGDSGGKILSVQSKQEVNISGLDLRIRPDTGDLEPISGATQYSLAFDDFGHRFGGNNSQPVWHYLLEDPVLRRNVHVKPPRMKTEIPEQPGNARIYPRSKTITRFNDYHTANRFTSACGIEIYRDTYFGDGFYGNTFVCEPVHNLVHREEVEPNGLTFKSRRPQGEEESEFLASTDNWFRPVMARTGPDGALYIADMYRLVIEHPTWIPIDWQEKLNVRAGDDKGRIYRVVRAAKPPREVTPLDSLNTVSLAAALDDPSGTRRDMVQQLLVTRGYKADAEPVLRDLAKNATLPQVRVQALCTLHGLRVVKVSDIRWGLRDKDPRVQRHAVRMAGVLFPNEAVLEERLLACAASDDVQLRLETAIALGRWKSDRAAEALATLAREHLEEPVIVAAVLTSLDRDKLQTFWQHASESKEAVNRLSDQFVLLSKELGEPKIAKNLFLDLADDKKWTSDVERMERAWELLVTNNWVAIDPTDSRVKNALVSLMTKARTLVLDEKQPVEQRIIAGKLLFQQVTLLTGDTKRRDYAFFNKLLTSDATPDALRIALFDEVKKSEDFPFDSLLYDRWIDRTQDERRAILDALAANDHARATLKKLLTPERFTPADIDATRLQLLSNHPDKEIQRAARSITKAVTLTDRADLVRAFQDVLELRGDVARGRAAFRKRCTACHKQEGEGKQIGPDLAALTDRSPQALLIAMLDPNRAVEAKFLEYLVITEGGQLINGVVLSETGTSLTLVSSDGKEHTILRKEIDILSSNKKSLMPEGLERDLSKQEFADVIAYLRATAVPPKKFDGNTPQVVKPNRAGGLDLTATNARIYGPKIIFEDKYKNLGWWQSEEDFAEWSLAVPAAGKYKVTLDYACDGSAAGDTLQLSIGGRTVLWKVAASGTWDDYKAEEIGTVELTAGPAEASLRSAGPVRNALIDLRAIRLELVK